jgi:transcriptional regulator with XRE-family HTH domain
MSFNYRKLRGRIIEKYGKQYVFAEKMDMSERTLSLKLNGKIYFSQDEIAKASKLLDISDEQIIDYFFNQKVQ